MSGSLDAVQDPSPDKMGGLPPGRASGVKPAPSSAGQIECSGDPSTGTTERPTT